jgi:antitoxin (DNA-binding transcriptional repressor) of toxin-antitoxin stability system
MKRASVRDLHLKTSAILNEVAEGEFFVIEKHGVPVAELRPPHLSPLEALPLSRCRLPDREAELAKLPMSMDSGRILEEDRS